MELVVDKLKGFGTATQSFFDGLVHRREKSSRRSPVMVFIFVCNIVMCFFTSEYWRFWLFL